MLQRENEAFSPLGELYSEIKADAYKEFAVRLKARFPYDPRYSNSVNAVASIFRNGIDNLLAELTDETFTKVEHNSLCETETYKGDMK
jgi:hypothetical protein